MTTNPVRPWHLVTMARRYADATFHRFAAMTDHGFGSPPHEKARRACERRYSAMLRLADALDRRISELQRHVDLHDRPGTETTL